MEAGDLSVGDKLVDRDGQEYPIESNTVRTEPTKVYNFRVQGHHNYFVTDLRIWTHNCGGGIGSSTSSTIYSSPGNVSRGSNLFTKNVPVPDAFQKLIRDQFNSSHAFNKGTGNVAEIGDNFGEAGIHVRNPEIKIAWSKVSSHGLERMAERRVTRAMAESWVKNGKALSQNNGSKHLYFSKEGAAVVANDGTLVTVIPKSKFDDAYNLLSIFLFGK